MKVARYIFTLFVLGYVLLFPSAPLKLSVLAVIFLASIPFALQDKRKEYMICYTIFGIYVLMVGVAYCLVGESEDLGRAVKSPAMLWMLGVVTWVALRPLKQGLLVVYAFFWNVIQFAGVVLNIKGVDTHNLLPFPVAQILELKEFADFSMEVRLERESRYYAFTGEGSILAGVSALLAVFVISHLLVKWLRMERQPMWLVLLVGLTMVLSCAISVLAKTKAGFVVMLGFGVFAWLGFLFSHISLAKKMLFSAGVLVAAVCFVVGLVAYVQVSPGAAEYMRQEYDRSTQLVSEGSLAGGGSGTGTRAEYAKIAVLGFFCTPWGVGASSGFAYANPVLDYVAPTAEMQRFFNEGIYNGYKAVLFNIMGMGGVVGLGCLLFMLGRIKRDWIRATEGRVLALGWGMVAALLALALCADGIPLFPLISLVGVWGAAEMEKYTINRSVRPTAETRMIITA